METYTCVTCKATFSILQNYNCHQYYHRNLINNRFYCKYPNCRFEFLRYKSYKMHIYRNHGIKKRDSLNVFYCNVAHCNFKTGLQNQIYSHMYKHIRNGADVKCPLLDCKTPENSYKTVSSLKAHIYRLHYKKYTSLKNSDFSSTELHTSEAMSANDFEMRIAQVNENESNNTDINLQELYLNSLATMYLTLQSKYLLTDSALQILIDGLCDINEISLQQIRKSLIQSGESQLWEAIDKKNLFKVAHNNSDGLLRSPYARKKYYRTKFNFVTPIDISLDKDDTSNTNSFFYYIPIRETLKVLLNNEHIYKLWRRERQSEPGTFTDIADGECFKNSVLFQDNPYGLQIILYQDSFEVCNPLGSSRKIHKILGIYMTLGNIPPYCRSKVDQIQLVALTLERDVKKFGLNKILDVVMRDVSLLETEGLEIKPNEFVKGTIVAVSGDNLGSHQIGGFAQNFSVNKSICRYCYTTMNEFTKNHRKSFPLRTAASYENDVFIALTTGKITNGVKSNSILNDSKYFNVCAPGLPPCLAHDIFEGIVPYDFMLCVLKLVSTKSFTIELLNDRLQSVRFMHEIKYDKVPMISKKAEKLVGSATENLRLLLILPFAVLCLVDDNPCWKMLQYLREISCLLMSVKLSSSQLAYLKYLILEYIQLRIDLFPDVKLKPKHHYIMHYPYLIRKFGPLRHLWTLRYESKHLYFKNILKHSPNFKNILRSLSQRHQLLQALHATQSTLFLDKVVSDQAVLYSDTDFDGKVSLFISSHCKFADAKFISTKVMFRGITYSMGMRVCCEKINSDNFMLCSINYIIIDSDYNDLFFFGNRSEITFNDLLGVYEELGSSKEFIGIHYNDLLSHDPVLHFVTKENNNLFAFKSAPFAKL